VGCAFAPRCELAVDECRSTFPASVEAATDHRVRCHRYGEMGELDRPQPVALIGRHDTEIALSVRDVDAAYTGVTVVRDVSFDVVRGECVALVGESGSGKTTISRSIGGLHHEWTGSVLLDGQPLARSARQRPTAQRLAIQYVFQNPYSSLHPRRTIGESVGRPLRIGGASVSETERAVDEMLERVSLTSAYAHRYPDQLSGGERQRVAIARALVSRPSVLVCDEVTSALDVLVQAAVIELLVGLQRDLGLSMLFVTHNLPLVRSLAQQVAVMADGKILELGPVDQVIERPEMEYTKRLLADTPSIVASTT
jgi:peptide/nickel transport system ATP-binding protein